MPHAAAARMASRERDAGRYQRHRPEQTLLYQIVDEYYPALAAHLAEQGRAGNYRVMCKGNLRNFSNAAAWNMVFCGCAASPAIPSTWLLSTANEEG